MTAPIIPKLVAYFTLSLVIGLSVTALTVLTWTFHESRTDESPSTTHYTLPEGPHQSKRSSTVFEIASDTDVDNVPDDLGTPTRAVDEPVRCHSPDARPSETVVETLGSTIATSSPIENPHNLPNNDSKNPKNDNGDHVQVDQIDPTSSTFTSSTSQDQVPSDNHVQVDQIDRTSSTSTSSTSQDQVPGHAAQPDKEDQDRERETSTEQKPNADLSVGVDCESQNDISSRTSTSSTSKGEGTLQVSEALVSVSPSEQESNADLSVGVDCESQNNNSFRTSTSSTSKGEFTVQVSEALVSVSPSEQQPNADPSVLVGRADGRVDSVRDLSEAVASNPGPMVVPELVPPLDVSDSGRDSIETGDVRDTKGVVEPGSTQALSASSLESDSTLSSLTGSPTSSISDSNDHSAPAGHALSSSGRSIFSNLSKAISSSFRKPKDTAGDDRTDDATRPPGSRSELGDFVALGKDLEKRARTLAKSETVNVDILSQYIQDLRQAVCTWLPVSWRQREFLTYLELVALHLHRAVLALYASLRAIDAKLDRYCPRGDSLTEDVVRSVRRDKSLTLAKYDVFRDWINRPDGFWIPTDAGVKWELPFTTVPLDAKLLGCDTPLSPEDLERIPPLRMVRLHNESLFMNPLWNIPNDDSPKDPKSGFGKGLKRRISRKLRLTPA